jgi:hypothetical protein
MARVSKSSAQTIAHAALNHILRVLAPLKINASAFNAGDFYSSFSSDSGKICHALPLCELARREAIAAVYKNFDHTYLDRVAHHPG